MREAFLLAVVVAVLYGYWLMMRFTFGLIDRAHEELRESERRNGGAPLSREQES